MRAIVFAIRGCPAGWLGAYGNEWVVTPHLDQFAAEGIAFDRHISDCPDPEAAGRAWLHGSRVLEQLHTADVQTVLLRANHTDTDAPAPFYDGWGEVFDARPQEEDSSPLDNLIRSLPSVLDRLANVPRWLLWVEVDRCLPPWDVPQDVFDAYLADGDDAELGDELEAPVTACSDPPVGPFDASDLVAWQWLQMSFASVITKLDAELGEAFEQMRSRGLDQTAAWLVTSDLGYPLGEHGLIGVKGSRLHEELVHVPLLLRLPGAAEAGRRVAGFTQPADVAGTLLELFDRSPHAPREVPHAEREVYDASRSLLSLARGERESIRSAAHSKLEDEVAIRTDRWAYIRSSAGAVLFSKPDDRCEVNDVLGLNEEAALELERLLPIKS